MDGHDSIIPPRVKLAGTEPCSARAQGMLLFTTPQATVVRGDQPPLQGTAVKAFITSLSLGLLLSVGASAQQATRTEPVEGIRDNGTGYHALVGARVVTAPGRTLDNATIVIRNGLIQSVQAGGTPPAGARVWDLSGYTVYPGFIDAHAELGRDSVPPGGDVGPTHWNPQVRAWFSATANLQDDANRRKGCARRASARRSSFPSGASSAAARRSSAWATPVCATASSARTSPSRSASRAPSSWVAATRTRPWA